ncbi:hypothetical protein K0M31_008089 [Melipona bicolor]|uniref:Maturase K n=1 Tax=Melipona bicolor TaxID=60889 RepID=A0AA40FQB0_9HYME|nr:hypothetical protein K0M31_008089 [Melipona bicolor]
MIAFFLLLLQERTFLSQGQDTYFLLYLFLFLPPLRQRDLNLLSNSGRKSERELLKVLKARFEYKWASSSSLFCLCPSELLQRLHSAFLVFLLGKPSNKKWDNIYTHIHIHVRSSRIVILLQKL